MHARSTRWNSSLYRVLFVMILWAASWTAQATAEGVKGWVYLDASKPGDAAFAPDPLAACEIAARLHFGSKVFAIRPNHTYAKGPHKVMYDCKIQPSMVIPPYWGALKTYLDCDKGYQPEWPGMCVKNPNNVPPPPSCSSSNPGFAVGDPVIISSGENVQHEVDLTAGGLAVRRTYRSQPGNMLTHSGGLGWVFWFERQFRLYRTANGGLTEAHVTFGDGSVAEYKDGGAGNGILFLDGKPKQETLRALDSKFGRVELTTTDSRIEYFQSVDGNYRLVSSTSPGGRAENYTYDNTGKLSMVTDTFGRILQIQWDGDVVVAISGADASVHYQYERLPQAARGVVADTALLTGMSLHDSSGALVSSRRYLYENEHYAHLLTGIVDENGKRYANFVYDGAAQVLIAEHAGGANRYAFDYPDNALRVVTDPLGTARTMSLVSSGISYGKRVSSISQPAGAGCSAADKMTTYDGADMVESKTDFSGRKVCYTNDRDRKLVKSRIEGLWQDQACPAVGNLGENQKQTSFTWHPDWPIEVRIAAPKLVTTYLYNGQMDSTGQLRTCAQGATLPNGKPIVVLCEKSEQETSDENGSHGFFAAPKGTPRVWRYSYNKQGQLLSKTGPRGANGLAAQEFNMYYADTTSTHMLGDQQSATNTAGETTTYLEYARHGLPTRLRHANGIATTLRYNLRRQVTSRLVQDAQGIARETLYSYDDAGQLTRMQGPDGSIMDYSHDDAHRLTGTRDGLGNSVQFTLDGMGNIVREEARNASGELTAQIARSYDALGRLERVRHLTDEAGISYEYDASENLKAITDALQRVHSMEYDAVNGLVQTVFPPAKSGGAGNTVSFSYNLQSQLTSVTDPRKLKTLYAVDGFGQRTHVDSPDSGIS